MVKKELKWLGVSELKSFISSETEVGESRRNAAVKPAEFNFYCPADIDYKIKKLYGEILWKIM